MTVERPSTVDGLSFIGIANSTYVDETPLDRAGTDSERLAEVLASRHGYETQLLLDVDKYSLPRRVDEVFVPGSLRGRGLIVCWIGHARRGPTGLEFVGQRTDADGKGEQDDIVATAADLGSWIARTGASQTLAVVDTCWAGAALEEAGGVAQAIIDGRADPGSAWFGVLAASLLDEKARSGTLVDRLISVLDGGPGDAVPGWHPAQQWVNGQDLIDAILHDWDDTDQQATHRAQGGSARPILANPRFAVATVATTVDHMVASARGSSTSRSFFVARRDELSRIVEWLDRREPGLFVVTGPPGCGKSAIVGRIVSLSDADERTRLTGEGSVPVGTDPGEGAVTARLHARGATARSAAQELGRQLALGDTDVNGVIAEARHRRDAGEAPLVVIDGLDEAGDGAIGLATDLIEPLARVARVLVSTRPEGRDADDQFVSAMGLPTEICDLGQAPDATLAAVRSYVVERLQGISPAMDADVVADRLVGTQEDERVADAPFLLARLVTARLRDHPIDTATDEVDVALDASVEAALEADLDLVELNVVGDDEGVAGRELLRALTFAHGPGLPADDVWPTLATELSTHGLRYERRHAYELLGQLGRHLSSGSEDGQTVVRIVHQRLADHLTAGASESDDDLARVAEVIHSIYDEHLRAGFSARRHVYLWRHAWLHLADAGATGLGLMRSLAEHDRQAFDPDVEAVLQAQAGDAFGAGRIRDAITLLDDAIEIARERVADGGVGGSLGPMLVQKSMAHLAVGEHEAADRLAREATELASADEGSDPGRLLSTMVSRANALVRMGDHETARDVAKHAVALVDSLPDSDDGWEPRAIALGLLAGVLSGRTDRLDSDDFDRDEIVVAIGHAERAIELVVDHADEGGDVLFAELSGSLAVLQLRLSMMDDPESPSAPAVDRAIERLRDRPVQGPFAAIALARCHVVRANVAYTRALSRGEPASLGDADLDFGAVYDLALPYADQIADAATQVASAVNTRSAIRQMLVALAAGGQGETSDQATTVLAALPELSVEDTVDPVEVLRPHARPGTPQAHFLSVLLLARSQPPLAQLITGTTFEGLDLDALIDDLIEVAEAVPTPIDNPQRVRALQGLVYAAHHADDTELADLAQADLLASLRRLAASSEDAQAQLVATLVDAAGREVRGDPVSGSQLAREALDLMEQLTNPELVEQLRPAAMLNEGAGLMMLGRLSEGIDRMRSVVEEVTRRAEPGAAALGALATATRNMAGHLLERGDPKGALDYARRSVDTYRTPGLPALARVEQEIAELLLARAMYELGDPDAWSVIEAAIQDAVDRLERGEWPIGLLARTLNACGADAWRTTLTAFEPDSEEFHLLAVQQVHPPDQVDVKVDALLAALKQLPEESAHELRHLARVERMRTEGFAEAWRAATGDVPDWLSVSVEQDLLVGRWVSQRSWRASEAFLREHPDLLDSATDLIIEELAWSAPQVVQADQHRAVLAAARAGDPSAGYGPLVAEETAAEWIGDDDPFEWLAANDERVGDDVVEVLDRWGADHVDAARVHAIAWFVRRGESTIADRLVSSATGLEPHVVAAAREGRATRLRELARLCPDAEMSGPAASIGAALSGRGGAAAILLESWLDGPDGDEVEIEAADVPTAGRSADAIDSARNLVVDTIGRHPDAAGELAGLIAVLSRAGSGED